MNANEFKADIDFLFNLGYFSIKLGLENISQLLKLLDNPQDTFKSIHIAGTNGKGSTLISLERLLIDSGYKVASTISPHLVKFNERFRFQAELISDFELQEVLQLVFESCGINFKNKTKPHQWKVAPTFFEAQIAMFFCWAKMKKPDFVIVETGLGGRLDATNVIKSIICGITHISLDHQSYLGRTLKLITNEKLGIVKPKTPCFVAKQNYTVNKVIKKHALASNFFFNGIDYGFIKNKQGRKFFTKFQSFKEEPTYNYLPVRAETKTYHSVIKELSLQGEHQWDNTALALALYFGIVDKRHLLDQVKIAKSLSSVFWQGRLEYIKYDPTIILEGAHNTEGIRALGKFLKTKFLGAKILLGISWMKDKQLATELSPLSSLNITFQPLVLNFSRAVEPEVATSMLKRYKLEVNSPLSISEFVLGIKNSNYKRFELIIVAGSLYLLGDFLKIWYEDI